MVQLGTRIVSTDCRSFQVTTGKVLGCAPAVLTEHAVMRTDLACTDKVSCAWRWDKDFLDYYKGHWLITYVTAEADEAYVIGKRGQYTPVGAYLAGDEIIKIALQHGVQMIHPGTTSKSWVRAQSLML